MIKSENKALHSLKHAMTFMVIVVFAVLAYATAESDDRFQQVGYFKSDSNQRVFTFNIERDIPESEIRSHAESRMHTDGSITYVFYYFGGAPNPTTASSLDRALQVTENSDYRYSFMKMANGQSDFTSHR